jgi:nucleoside diphosphate kinase
MKKLIKKIKKIMAEIDKIEAKEETLREDLSEAIDELEESNDY